MAVRSQIFLLHHLLTSCSSRLQDTLGSVGVIISTLLIQFYGWTGFDPIASLFIAVLIAASVIPLVMDTGRILALDVSEKDREIQEALDEVCPVTKCSFVMKLIKARHLYNSCPPSKVWRLIHALASGPRMRRLSLDRSTYS